MMLTGKVQDVSHLFQQVRPVLWLGLLQEEATSICLMAVGTSDLPRHTGALLYVLV